MALTKKQTAAIHVAKKQLGLSDDEYRAVLYRVAGVSSSMQMNGFDFELLITEFISIGWRPALGRQFFGFRDGMAAPGQVALIRALWDEYTGTAGTDLTLGKWLHRTFGVSSLRFLAADKVPKVIAALKAMKARRAAHGTNPAATADAPPRGERTPA